MTESVSEVSKVDADGDDLMPFRLRDMKLRFNASNIHPIFDPIDEIRKQIKFIALLAYTELTKNRSIMLAFGILAFFLGSVNGNVISGGDSTTSGMDGLMEVGSFPFFQMLISIVCWVVFLYYLWMEFPVMRTHSIILVLIWNGITLANILFHQNNKNFPSDIVLAETMYGTLIMLVVVFFTYFFWKAVSDTRDLHVQVHHVHEDVRVMEAEMYEHSLRGWGTLLLIWLSTTFISAWSGIHFVATRNSEQFGYLITHLMTGMLLIPMLVLIIWYPQRMLGDNTKISTAAALTAEIEMSQGELTIKTEAKCPECAEHVKVSVELDGRLSVPCANSTCVAMGIVGTECETCGELFPARFDCISCGVNVPYVDCIPDSEAW